MNTVVVRLQRRGVIGTCTLHGENSAGGAADGHCSVTDDVCRSLLYLATRQTSSRLVALCWSVGWRRLWRRAGCQLPTAGCLPGWWVSAPPCPALPFLPLRRPSFPPFLSDLLFFLLDVCLPVSVQRGVARLSVTVNTFLQSAGGCLPPCVDYSSCLRKRVQLH